MSKYIFNQDTLMQNSNIFRKILAKLSKLITVITAISMSERKVSNVSSVAVYIRYWKTINPKIFISPLTKYITLK